MSAPSMHDAYYARSRSKADAQSEIGEASAHLDTALEHHAKHLHGRVKTSIEDAQRCLQRALGAAAPTSSQIANPTGKMGAQTSAGQSSRAVSHSERQAQLQRLRDATP
jgi:hypothetical protein